MLRADELPRLLLVAVMLTACGDDATPIDAGPRDVSIDIGAMDGAVDAPVDVGDAGTPIISSSEPCLVDGIRTVVVAANEAQSHRLTLRYRVFESERADAPTVVVVPGGPGQALIEGDATVAFALSGAPIDDFTIIYTDARGSGCNTYPEIGLPDEDIYSIERVAEDLAAIVRNEGLTDYYMYGASFGTVASTVAVSRMEERGDPLPHRLVLEGIVGRAFDSFDSYFAAFENEWARVEPMVEEPWRTDFATEPWPESLTYTRAQWGTFIAQQLILGDYPGQGPILNFWLRGLDRGTPTATNYVSNFMSAIPDEGFDGASTLFRTIACRELWGSWRSGREIRDGELRAIGTEVCAGEPRTGYDSAEFLSTVPVTYFHGPFDPTTTTEQAEYHFDSHTGSARELIVVPEASHAPLTLGLAGRGCVEDVWAAIAGERDMATVLGECEQPGETIEIRFRDD